VTTPILSRRAPAFPKLVLTAIALVLPILACRTLLPNSGPTRTPPPIATSAAEATAFAVGQDFTLVRIYPQDGDLQSQLAAEAKKAKALGQMPFVEFDATWCPPCQKITAALAHKDALMLRAYSGIYLIHADVDQWGWRNPQAGFSFDAIPVFYRLDADGKSTGDVIDGGAWGADIPENIAPVLQDFFHQ